MKKLYRNVKNWVIRLRHRGCNHQWPVNGMSRCMDHPWVEWDVPEMATPDVSIVLLGMPGMKQ